MDSTVSLSAVLRVVPNMTDFDFTVISYSLKKIYMSEVALLKVG